MPRATTARKRSTTTKTRPTKVRTAKGFPNYQSAVRYLLERTDVERMRPSRIDPKTFKLDRIRHILNELDRPEEALLAVHVAGTNGKGSTLALTEACLRACGYAVGSFTSPHLTDLRERIRINDSLISYPQFTELMGRVAKAADTLPKKLGEPTFFELITALGLLHFADQAVDVALIEVGLGGRLDSTNVVTPAVTAITQIGLDHTQILGDTMEKIAAEKAGIFKAGVPALTIAQPSGVLPVLKQAAEDANTTLEVVGKDIDFSYRFESSPQLGPHFRIGLSTPRLSFEHLPVPLPGEHQALNAGLALAIVDKLAQRGLRLPETPVFEGLASTTIPGRMELIPGAPRIILDGAHNPAAMGALVKSIGAHIPYDSMVMIFGCAEDKDIDGLLKEVALGADKVIFTKAKASPRSADPEDLQTSFAELSGKMSQVAPDLKAALDIARRAATRDDLVCITGSFYIAGEARKLLVDR